MFIDAVPKNPVSANGLEDYLVKQKLTIDTVGQDLKKTAEGISSQGGRTQC